MLNSLKSLVDTDILSLLTPKRQLVGLDIGSSGIKLVQLKENRGRYILQKFGFKPLEPEALSNLLARAEEVEGKRLPLDDESGDDPERVQPRVRRANLGDNRAHVIRLRFTPCLLCPSHSSSSPA